MVPRWECGYRCHGYLDGTVRCGVVSIHARRFGPIPPEGGYALEFTPDGVVNNLPEPEYIGLADTLAEAKQQVEAAYQKWINAR